MRAWIFVALAACSPDIGSGSYLCGPNETCPKGQACDGPTNSCIVPSAVEPFACDPKMVRDDNTPQTALALGTPTCVSNNVPQSGCLGAGDSHNYYAFTAPMGCTAVEVDLRISYPKAFEPLGITLGDANGTELVTDGECKGAQISTTADDVRCIQQTITPGQPYTIDVNPAGGEDCDGMCAFNRYTLNFALATPG